MKGFGNKLFFFIQRSRKLDCKLYLDLKIYEFKLTRTSHVVCLIFKLSFLSIQYYSKIHGKVTMPSNMWKANSTAKSNIHTRPQRCRDPKATPTNINFFTLNFYVEPQLKKAIFIQKNV